jgi:Tfp pilus assembly protein PilE
MERHFVRNNTYIGASIGNDADDIIKPTTEGNRYILTFSNGPTADTFILQATPQATDRCGYLRLSQTGAKTSESCGNW